MTKTAAVASLAKGDLRTTGSAAKVARQAVKDPELVRELLKALSSEDAGLARRSAAPAVGARARKLGSVLAE